MLRVLNRVQPLFRGSCCYGNEDHTLLSKIQVFLWQLCHNALPSRGTLLRRRLPIDPVCPAYLSQIKDTEHLFASCKFTTHVWQSASKHGWIPQPPFLTTPHSIRDALHKHYIQCRRMTVRIVVLL